MLHGGVESGGTVVVARPAARTVARTVVGIDLAWSPRNATGVVVLDGRRVVASATVVPDDEIVGLVPDGPVLVAIDAPVVVPNETGRRPCDAAISACFARFHAGAYPANRSIPWLADPRAGQLADRLGLSTDPCAERAVVEVYPHAATIALFGLDRVLPYKRGRGRGVDDRRAALDELCRHLEELAGTTHGIDVAAGPRWAGLREAVTGAVTGADLGRVEDELDAHVCAQVGALLAADPALVDVVGEPAQGAIVVPASPRTSPCLADT
jgi:predicted RNase H-like nuclease